MLQPNCCFLRSMSEIIKSNYITALAIVALVIISAFAITRSTVIDNGAQNLTQRTITVNGVGTVETAPDEAILTLAVNNQAVTADQAAKDNANTMSQVMAAILSLGVAKDGVTTVDYSLTPVYAQSDKCVTTGPSPPQPFTCTTVTSRLIGYAVRNAIQATVKDMNSIGKVLDSATGAGANEIGGISFTFTSSTYANLQKQALQKAIQDASGQAQTMATGLGVRITGVLSVNPAYVYQPYINSKVSTAAGGAPTPIQMGTLQVTVNVQVVYEIST
jgi:uncharacterized protein